MVFILRVVNIKMLKNLQTITLELHNFFAKWASVGFENTGRHTHTHTRKNWTRYQLTDSRHLEPITKLKWKELSKAKPISSFTNFHKKEWNGKCISLCYRITILTVHQWIYQQMIKICLRRTMISNCYRRVIYRIYWSSMQQIKIISPCKDKESR